jgi:hypothetical protein
MKNLLIVVFLITSSMAFGQGMNIKWEDQDGREFSITAPTGDFTYGMIAGDNIRYDYKDRVSSIGLVTISYDYQNRVSRVGSVSIRYDYQDRVSHVGGLSIYYDYNDRISSTSGSVTY